MPGMEKLLRGVLRYRNGVRQELIPQFERVRDNPEPTAILFTCMDSRMLPTRFCQTNVGDMFMVRNAGNLIPHSELFCGDSLNTEPAALELACIKNDINHVIVCGHSDCKAMNCLYGIRNVTSHDKDKNPFAAWLAKFGKASLNAFKEVERGSKSPLKFTGETPKHNFEAFIDPDDKFGIEDKLSQVNCLQQLQNISSYGFLKDRLESGRVRLHAMWFDIYAGDVYLFSRQAKRFVEINEETCNDLLKDCEHQKCHPIED
ncbi:carbonic anhydrase-like [Saccoglossus kowalevskii]|uniref:Carbonic anhydrase n=1 Tax=Saccoglossus kowalevskii TaxID=10224 RepID=A0ABM0GGT4_SACKO|nr:carbonic anhydrase-like [Saccoglossus kowalevskii]